MMPPASQADFPDHLGNSANSPETAWQRESVVARFRAAYAVEKIDAEHREGVRYRLAPAKRQAPLVRVTLSDAVSGSCTAPWAFAGIAASLAARALPFNDRRRRRGAVRIRRSRSELRG